MAFFYPSLFFIHHDNFVFSFFKKLFCINILPLKQFKKLPLPWCQTSRIPWTKVFTVSFKNLSHCSNTMAYFMVACWHSTIFSQRTSAALSQVNFCACCTAFFESFSRRPSSLYSWLILSAMS